MGWVRHGMAPSEQAEESGCKKERHGLVCFKNDKIRLTGIQGKGRLTPMALTLLPSTKKRDDVPITFGQ